jgi:colicin import membrane protein
MNPALKYEEPGGKASAVLAVLVHVLFLAFLVVGVRWQTSRPEAVVVELWDRAPVEEQPAPQVEPPPPQPKPEPKIEPKPQPKVEPKPSKPDIAVEREKKRPKKEPPKKEPPKKVEEPPLKLDPTERIREELAREMEALKQPKQRAESTRPAAPAAAPVLDAGYAEKIRARIKPNIVVPSGIRDNPEAIFDVVQLPTGDVISVRLRKSSGHRAYDEAVERAILKSSPLPRPDRSEMYRRELQLKFRPQE